MTADATTRNSKRVPGPRRGPAQRDELLRIWGHGDDDGCRLMQLFARMLVRDQGFVPPKTPLLMTDRVF
jgi:hypothetical protein